MRTILRACWYALAVLFLLLGWLIGWSNSAGVTFSIANWFSVSYPAYIFYFLFLTVGVLIGLILGRFLFSK